MRLPDNISLKKGKYQIVRCLGQGGYGITYLATTTGEMRGDFGTIPVKVPVAIKEFFVKTYSTRDDLTHDVAVHTEEGKVLVPQLRKDFIREAQSMAEMSHPSIVKVIDFFEEHQTAYYVMEYLEGGSLADKVGRSGPLDCDTAKKYLFQIGNAVSYLHDRHICHYDLKPANIMLPNGDKAVLIDFGISRHYDDQGNSTTARPVGHSEGFSPPEQIMGDTSRFSPASDIYSLAAILYFMLTGRIPSDSREALKSMDSCLPDVPEEMRKAVAAGMDADISKRPQTVTEWLSLLDDSTRQRPEKGGDEPSGNPDPVPPQNPLGPTEPPVAAKPPKLPKPPVHWKKWVIVLISLALVITALYLLLSHVSSGKASGHKTEVSGMPYDKKNRYGNTFTFTGTVIDSIPNGYGKASYSDGSSYEGVFRDGLREDSEATYIDPDGNTFTGTFRNDSIVQGRVTAPDGRYYEGEFSNDQPYQGTWYYGDGEVMWQVNKGELTDTGQ